MPSPTPPFHKGNSANARKVLNIVVFGAHHVGKTSMVAHWITDDGSNPQRIGRVVKKEVICRNRAYEYNITDTTGHLSSTPLFAEDMIGTHAYILVYSFEDPDSLHLIEALYHKITDYCGSERRIPIIIAGNKADTHRRNVSYFEAQQLALKLNCLHLTTSIVWKRSLDQLFKECIAVVENPAIHSPIGNNGTLSSHYLGTWLASVASAAPSIMPSISIPRNINWALLPKANPISFSPSPKSTPSSFSSISTVLSRSSGSKTFDDSTNGSVSLATRLFTRIRRSSWRSDSIIDEVPKQFEITFDATDILMRRSLFIEELNNVLNFFSSHTIQLEDKLNLAIRVSQFFLSVSKDKSVYKELLSLKGDEAQVVLDTLQWAIDSRFKKCDRPILLKMLLRLSKHAGTYPSYLGLQGVSRIGDYPVASGHFGEIWKGRYGNQSVCLKVVRVYQRHHVDHFLKVFFREAVLWSQLEHINVLPFYGIFDLQDNLGRVCLVSPWMENGTLREYLSHNSDVDHCLLASDVTDGLQHLHGEGIIHGDLKGDNILVNSYGYACIADFGLSNLVDGEMLHWTSSESTGLAAGTARWQAPELLNPDDGSCQPSKYSDIYSLGCVFYEIFTGNVPFCEIPREATVIALVQAGKSPSKPTHDCALSRMDEASMELIWFCMDRCWSRDVSLRPSLRDTLHIHPFRDAWLRDTRTRNEKEGPLTSSAFRYAVRFEAQKA